MSFIKNDNRILKINLIVFSYLWINDIIVRHQNQIRSPSSILLKVIGTNLVCYSLMIQVFNISDTPINTIGMLPLSCVSIKGTTTCLGGHHLAVGGMGHVEDDGVYKLLVYGLFKHVSYKLCNHGPIPFGVLTL